jgi:hypothetical protein
MGMVLALTRKKPVRRREPEEHFLARYAVAAE